MDEGQHWLVDEIDRVVLGDQHHAEAVEALRNARGKSWTLLVESENADDDPDKPIKPATAMFSSIKNVQDGHGLYRLAVYFQAIATRYGEMATSARANWMMSALMGQGESEEDPQ